MVLTILTIILSLKFFAVQAYGQAQYESEAQRLERIRAMISQEKNRELREQKQAQKFGGKAGCEKMLADLLDGVDFEPIEPVAILSHEYPVISPYWERSPTPEENELTREAEKKIKPWLARGLRRCASAEAEGDARRAHALFNSFNYAAGMAPYRIYVLQEKINPYPDSKIIYWSEFSEKIGSGRKGYSWVNLDICEHTSGVDALTDSLRIKNDPDGQVGALAVYKGKLASWVVARGFMFKLDYYGGSHLGGSSTKMQCTWTVYSESPKNI